MNPFERAPPALQTLYERVRQIPPVDAGHAFDHTERVARECQRLFFLESTLRGREASPVELECAWLAGLLHDCVPIAKNSPLRSQSAKLCAEQAQSWLQELGRYGAAEIQAIVAAIEDHSYSSGKTPRTWMGQVLQDADRLEALGAMGLYRTIATGVAMGSRLFDPDDPWAQNRKLDDHRFTIDHFYTKLLKLPLTFWTQSAQVEAQRRAAFLERFLVQLRSELEFSWPGDGPKTLGSS